MFRWLLVSCLLVPWFAPAEAVEWQERPGWSKAFAGQGVSGTMLVLDERADRWLVFDRARAERRFIPASTFKVFNALASLDGGAVKDEYETIRWDGTKRAFDDWNRDQSLASAMKFSAVWFYQAMARRVGAERMQGWIERVGYGNRDIGGGIDRFWLDGALRISAVEQIGFLRRLAHGTLPFSSRAQEAVRRITLLESAPDYALHAKTGWAVRAGAADDADLGWIVGWVERDGRRWFFALNVDMPGGAKDAAKRLPLARGLLVEAGALPK